MSEQAAFILNRVDLAHIYGTIQQHQPKHVSFSVHKVLVRLGLARNLAVSHVYQRLLMTLCINDIFRVNYLVMGLRI